MLGRLLDVARRSLSESGRDDVLDFLLSPTPGAKVLAPKERGAPIAVLLLTATALLEAKALDASALLHRRQRSGCHVCVGFRRTLIADAALPVARGGDERPRDRVAPAHERRNVATLLAGRALAGGGTLRAGRGVPTRHPWDSTGARRRSIPGAACNCSGRCSIAKLPIPSPGDGERRSYHAIALTEARRYEETVSHKLGERVLAVALSDSANVWPRVTSTPIRTATAATPEPISMNWAASLRWRRSTACSLVLYAEDRVLLPVRDERYEDYSLTVLRY